MAKQPTKKPNLKTKVVDLDVSNKRKRKPKLVDRITNAENQTPVEIEVPEKIVVTDHKELTKPEKTEADVKWFHLTLGFLGTTILVLLAVASGIVTTNINSYF